MAKWTTEPQWLVELSRYSQDTSGLFEDGHWRLNGPTEFLKRIVDALNSVEDSRQDTARLDWLGYTGHGFVRGTDVSKWSIEAPEEGIRVLRQAIDAARAKEPEAVAR